MKASNPVPVRVAQELASVVEAAIALPGVDIELCAFPEVAPETLIVVEKQSVLLLGLSPLLGGSEGRFKVAGTSRFARFGLLSFRPAGTPVELRFEGGAFHTIRCRFSGEPLRLTSEVLNAAQLAACFDIRAPRIEEAMLRLAEETSTPRGDSVRLAEGLIRVILVDLDRYLREAGRLAERRSGGLAPRHLRRMLDRIDQPGPPPLVTELAALCGVSCFHFIRSFGETMGKSPGAYVAESRMARAKAMLATGDMSLRDIAHELGYASLPAFITAFRRAVGRTPGAYRACLR
jgi:AraC family transcriptional regulator